MRYISISLTDKELDKIKRLKNKKGLTWRGVLINWYYNNK